VPNTITRRVFTQSTAAAGAAALSYSAARAENIAGANERIRVGMIGVGNRGGQLLKALMQQSDVRITAICDVYQSHLEKTAARLEGRTEKFSDFRKLIDDADIDAVFIATPDHWHAIQAISACGAGKDVYVEKPLSITVREGRAIVDAARRHQRIVQVGTQRRSAGIYHQLLAMVHSGRMGKVTVSRAYRLSNMHPDGIGRRAPATPPKELDWDLWLGPRPMQPYQDNIAPYKFRWWQLFSSQMANWGVHYLDVMRWAAGEQGPTSVCAMGGRFAVNDDRTIPDTAEAMFEFSSGLLAVFGVYEASGNAALREGELELRGTRGTAYVDGNRLRVIPERGGQFQDPTPRMEPIDLDDKSSSGDPTVDHVRNFLDCVKSRELPAADVEIGHRSTTMSLLANISLATRARIEWDPEREVITSPADANQLLHYEYRAPWTLG
jgi:predicted dehydrogenase